MLHQISASFPTSLAEHTYPVTAELLSESFDSLAVVFAVVRAVGVTLVFCSTTCSSFGGVQVRSDVEAATLSIFSSHRCFWCGPSRLCLSLGSRIYTLVAWLFSSEIERDVTCIGLMARKINYAPPWPSPPATRNDRKLGPAGVDLWP